MRLPRIIQGGMGVGVSGWSLARAVAILGQLGVVSGTALAVILARRLQLGDPSGQMRHALAQFPVPAMAERILDRYYVPGGKPPAQPFRGSPVPTLQDNAALAELTVAANFVEIFLAKEGHDGPVGVNYLEKVQLPTLASLYGSMLAGVDYVLMGAGIPRAIPGALDALADGRSVDLRIDILDSAATDKFSVCFDPSAFLGRPAPSLKRPMFLPVVSSATLAMTLARKSNGRVDGFIVEGACAGGHNAPPRGPMKLSERGEPVYSERDLPDIEKIRAIGLPFWMAGSFADPPAIAQALQMGAAGVQVGTAFAFCDESGLEEPLKRQVLAAAAAGSAAVFTDPNASPTGFPFKVLQVDGSLSDSAIYDQRPRGCDIGYLRLPYGRPDGSVGYRCPAEPLEQFAMKGGDATTATTRKCLCNGLLAAVGLGQVQANGETERPVLTAGEDVKHVTRFLKPGRSSYTAADVIRYLLTPAAPPTQLAQR